MHLTLAEFLGRLEGVTGGGGQYSAKCPNHGDQHNSLSISAGQDGRVLLHCHAGCSTEDIVWSMGLQMKDLFVETTPGEAFPVYSAPKGNRPTAKFEAEYIYHGGDLKKVKMRQTDGGKYFAWRLTAAIPSPFRVSTSFSPSTRNTALGSAPPPVEV